MDALEQMRRKSFGKMRKVLIKSVSSIASTLVAISVAFLIWRQPVVFGEYPLVLRAILLNVMVLAILGALYPFFSINLRAVRKYQGYLFLLCCAPAFVFYLFVLPFRSLDMLSLEQQDSTLLSDRSSNGIIEIGFQYPIFTPAISIINRGAYSREVNIFLRIIDTNQEIVDDPSKINQDPENNAWFFKLKIKDKSEMDSLMNKEDYDKFAKENNS